MSEESPNWTTQQVATYWNVSVKTVERWAERGLLACTYLPAGLPKKGSQAKNRCTGIRRFPVDQVKAMGQATPFSQTTTSER